METDGGKAKSLYRRVWDTDAHYVPFPQQTPPVPARQAVPLEVPSTVGRLRGVLEEAGYQVEATYAQGYKLGTHTPVETVALRVDRDGRRVAWATWVLGPPTKKGARSGKADAAWHRSGTSPTGWVSVSVTEWKAHLSREGQGIIPTEGG